MTRSPYPEQARCLSVLCRAPADAVNALAESILPALGAVDVLQNRTGLVMVPAVDSAEGAVFHLGEALVSEAHVRIEAGTEGYAMRLGRDRVAALAVALLDAALAADIATEAIRAFVAQQAEAQRQEDEALLRGVAATHVEMETF